MTTENVLSTEEKAALIKKVSNHFYPEYMAKPENQPGGFFGLMRAMRKKFESVRDAAYTAPTALKVLKLTGLVFGGFAVMGVSSIVFGARK